MNAQVSDAASCSSIFSHGLCSELLLLVVLDHFLKDLVWSSKQNPLLFSLHSLQQVKSYSSLSLTHTTEWWVLKKDVFYLRMLLQRLNCEHRFGGSQAWAQSNIELHKASLVVAFELKLRLNFCQFHKIIISMYTSWWSELGVVLQAAISVLSSLMYPVI